MKRMLEAHEVGHDQLHVEAFAEDLASAIERVKVVTWDAIRRERFPLTPEGMFDEVSRSAATLLSRIDGETARRRAGLREPAEEADAPDLSLPDFFPKDPFDCDLDKFKQKTGKAPLNWKKTVQQASKVIIDDMRTKLELHYDDVHLQKWREKHANDARRAPGRRGAYKVFGSIAEVHRRKLNQDLELPAII